MTALAALGVAVALPALLAGVMLCLRRAWIVVTVEGRSMLPALAPGDRVLVRRMSPARIRAGEIVVAARPVPDSGGPATARWIVKRLAAGPGDAVPPGVRTDLMDAGDRRPAGAARVPSGHFVLLGDNLEESVDSRLFGPVPGDRIVGRARRLR